MLRFPLHALRQGVLALVLLAAVVSVSAETVEVRVGYQKSSTLITLLKSAGTLDRELAAQHAQISWHEFTSGAPLLEALNVGGIDLSADVADTVPVFALAAGAKFTYYAQETPSPGAQAILVRAESPIRSVAQLRGKRIAVAKAAGAQEQIKARVLTDGANLATYRRYYLAASDFARAHPKILQIVFEALQERGHWVKSHPQEAAAVLSPIWGLDARTTVTVNSRRSYDVQSVSPQALLEQQKIADTFLGATLLAKAVNVSTVQIWKP